MDIKYFQGVQRVIVVACLLLWAFLMSPTQAFSGELPVQINNQAVALYTFDEAYMTNLDCTALNGINIAELPLDLIGPGGSNAGRFRGIKACGITGKPQDISFDNSNATHMGGSGGLIRGKGLGAALLKKKPDSTFCRILFSGWTRVDGAQTPGNRAILFQGDSGRGLWEFAFDEKNRLQIKFDKKSLAQFQFRTRSDEWFFWAIELSGSLENGTPIRMAFFKGDFSNTVSEIGSKETSEANLASLFQINTYTIAANAGGDQAFDGWLDNLRWIIQSKELSNDMLLQFLENIRKADMP